MRSARRLLILLAYLLGICLASAPAPAHAQSPARIQYTYDAAGNLIGVTRTEAPLPDLTVSNLSVGTITAVGNGAFNIPVTFQVNNVGTATAVASWYDRGYLATTATLRDTDQVLAGSVMRSTNLAAAGNYIVSTTLTTSTTTAPGTWMLIVKADGGASPSGQFSPTGPNYVDEFDDFNNTQSVAISLPANPKPDLTLSNLAVGAIAINQNGSYNVPVTFQVNNVGIGPAVATWYDRGYLSTDAVLDNADTVLSGNNFRLSNLAAGASYPVSLTLTTATTLAPGTYNLFVKADGGASASGQHSPTGASYVAELDETNNTQMAPVTFPARPDLTVSNLAVGAVSVNQNGSYNVPVTFQVNNVGISPAVAAWYDRGYLSTDAVLDNADTVLSGNNFRLSNLAAGANYPVSLTLTTTTSIAPGSYTLVVKADGGASASGQHSPTGASYVAELDETNNTQTASIALPTRPDLTVSELVVGTITPRAGGGYTIPVSFTVTNAGQSAAKATWYDRGYLSADATLANTDQVLGGTNTRIADLAPGASYNVNLTLTTSAGTTAGTYTLFVKADGGANSSGQFTPTGPNYVAEADEANNVAAATVALP